MSVGLVLASKSNGSEVRTTRAVGVSKKLERPASLRHTLLTFQACDATKSEGLRLCGVLYLGKADIV